jgi:hypothetical protein
MLYRTFLKISFSTDPEAQVRFPARPDFLKKKKKGRQ